MPGRLTSIVNVDYHRIVCAMLTAQEASNRLGIKPQSLYAYVSRGLIERHHDTDGRSRFPADAVDALARRGRPRLSSRTTSLHLTIETRLTRIDDHRILYRGQQISELAETRTFEDVADLLWLGELPVRLTTWAVGVAPPAPHVADSGALDRVRIAAACAGVGDPWRNDLSPIAVAHAGRRLVNAAIAGCAEGAGGATRAPRLSLPGSPAVRGSVAGRLWAALAPRRPRPGMIEALNALLIVAADHELAASTLAARVAASARADPYDVVGSALGVFGGALHGRASTLVRAVLDDASAGGASRAVAGALRVRNGVPGFGHPLYPDGDPRGAQALRMLRAAAQGSRELAVVESVLDAFRAQSDVEPNVDYALGAFTLVAQMPPDSSEVIFAVARIAGWLGHAIEEYGESPLRFRPRAVYTGNR